MARILILGTGNAQYDVLKRAQELGFEVYACSTPRPSHDLPFWTGYREINITDAAAVGAYAREIGADFIYSVGSDVAMPTVTQVSEELNLPHFISSETARICNNKQLLRQHLGHDFPGNLPFCILRDEADLANVDFFPVIVKPVDSQGQRGISQCREAAELSAAYHKALEHSRSKVVIAEKLLEEAFEISVNAYLYNGELLVFEPSDRISYSEFPGGIIKEHYLPSQRLTREQEEKVYSLVTRSLHKLSILNGPAYFQIMIEGDEAYLIEVTPRLDGCHMWHALYCHKGLDLLTASLEHLKSGKKPDFTKAEARNHHVCLHFPCQPPETPLNKARHQLPADLLHLHWYYEEGEPLRRMNGYMEKGGYWIRAYRED